nr:hypothetical protein [Mycobacterium intracellulare]
MGWPTTGEVLGPIRRWREPNCSIDGWTEMLRGGHFAAFEQPRLFVDDVSEFFDGYR